MTEDRIQYRFSYRFYLKANNCQCWQFFYIDIPLMVIKFV